MKGIFNTSFYLRRNYTNKEGKSPVLARIYLNNERIYLGSTGVTTYENKWDSAKGEVKGKTVEAVSANERLKYIRYKLDQIYRKLADSSKLSLERIKAEYLGKCGDLVSIMQLFDKQLDIVKNKSAFL